MSVSNNLCNNLNNNKNLLTVYENSHNIRADYSDTERIYIHPKDFSEASPLEMLQDNWFVNLSSIDIPLEIQLVTTR